MGFVYFDMFRSLSIVRLKIVSSVDLLPISQYKQELKNWIKPQIHARFLVEF